MTFPLVYFLYAYFVFAAVWAALSLVGLYHLISYGSRMFGSFFLGIVYLAGVIVIAYVSYGYLNQIDWQSEISIFENINFLNLSSSPSNSFNSFK
jgi:ABC-type maltose transport system permease subunit